MIGSKAGCHWTQTFLFRLLTCFFVGLVLNKGSLTWLPNLYLAESVFGRICIWLNLYLAESVFGRISFWSNLYLAKSLYDQISIWPNLYLAITLFGWISIWPNLYLAERGKLTGLGYVSTISKWYFHLNHSRSFPIVVIIFADSHIQLNCWFNGKLITVSSFVSKFIRSSTGKVKSYLFTCVVLFCVVICCT